MLEYAKKLLDPSMVSLWVPSGQKRAVDLRGRNHGQGYGAVPVISAQAGLINPAIGWVFDGTDDYIDCGEGGGSLDFGTGGFALGMWVKLLTTTHEVIIAKANHATSLSPFILLVYQGNWALLSSSNGTQWNIAEKLSIATATINLWHFIVLTRVGNVFNLYLNGSLIDTGTSALAVWPNDHILTLGHEAYDPGGGAGYFNGSIALPFTASAGWSVKKIGNFYRMTKGLFSPRG